MTPTSTLWFQLERSGVRSEDIATLGVLASAVAVGIIFALASSSPELNPLFGLLNTILSFAMLVTAMSVVTVSKMNFRERLSLVWFCFMLAVMLWFISEVTWQFYTYSYIVTTDFSDVFGLAAYLPALIGLGLHLNPFWAEFRTKKTLLASSSVVGSGLALFVWLYLTVPAGNIPAITVIAASGYLILDFTILALGIPLVLFFSTGTFWKPFVFLLCGIVLALLSQVLAVLVALSGATYFVRPADLILDLAYLTAAWGFYLRMTQTVDVGSVVS